MLRAVTAGAFYFLIIFAVAFVLGVLRVLLLAPAIGESMAILLEVPLLLVLSWFVCAWLVERGDIGKALGERLLMGGTALTLILVAEIPVSVFMIGRTLAEHFTIYATSGALIGLIGQIVMALFPAIQLFVPQSAGR